MLDFETESKNSVSYKLPYSSDRLSAALALNLATPENPGNFPLSALWLGNHADSGHTSLSCFAFCILYPPAC